MTVVGTSNGYFAILFMTWRAAVHAACDAGPCDGDSHGRVYACGLTTSSVDGTMSRPVAAGARDKRTDCGSADVCDRSPGRYAEQLTKAPSGRRPLATALPHSPTLEGGSHCRVAQLLVSLVCLPRMRVEGGEPCSDSPWTYAFSLAARST